MFKKLFTAVWVALLCNFCQLAIAAPTVSVSATPNSPIAPATVTLAVTATSDGNPVIATQVEYFNGTTSLGVSVQSPFTLTLDNLAAGTYQISAKVTTTDPSNPVLQSVPLAVVVGTAPGAAVVYFIHTDQLHTTRAITDSSGNLVWQWDSDPFGKDTANEQPAGQQAFTFNQRFPGQQFDRETNLHYNYFRDYDPSLGRYVQSDPIGLEGGLNTYAYVDSNPVVIIDLYGLNGTKGGGGTQPRNFGKGKPMNPTPTADDVRRESERVQEHGQNLADVFKCNFGFKACEAENEIKKATICLKAECSSTSCPDQTFVIDYRLGQASAMSSDSKCKCVLYGFNPAYRGGQPPGLTAPGR